MKVALASSVAGFALLLLTSGAYGAAGSLDPTFDGDGRVTLDLGSADEAAVDVAIQADGKIVVLGRSGTSSVLARFDSTGAPDSTFDGDGHLVFNSFAPQALLVQPNGMIVVAGAVSGDFAVARFENDGTPDATFDDDGLATFDFANSSNDVARGVALQPDGHIVGIGSSDENQAAGAGVIFRFTSEGVRNSWGGAWCCSPSAATAVAVQPNGKIVVAGWNTPGWDTDDRCAMLVTRYRPNGALDSSFGGDGWVPAKFGPSARAFDVALQPDGKIVAAGSAAADFALAHYTWDGKLDRTFSKDGKRRMDFSDGEDEARAVVVQPNGRIVVAGFADGLFALARFWPNGDLDRSFSANGKQRARFGANDQDYGFALALQPDGGLLVAGQATETSGDVDLGLARFFGS